MSKYSLEHINYLKKKKKEKVLIHFFRILIITCFLGLWEILSKFGLINSFLFSSPSIIINKIIKLFIEENLLFHIGVTLFEVFVSFIISFLIGIVVASIFWKKRIIFKILDPYIMILNSLPKVALGPLIIIWMGARLSSVIFMAITISLFSTIISLYNGFLKVNSNELLLFKSFKASFWQIYFKLLLPSSIENIISTLKLNISLNFIGVIMGELLVSKMGLGYLIMYGSQVFNIDLVLSSIIILSILAYLLYVMMNYIYFMKKKKI